MADEDDLLGDDLNLDYEVDELPEEDLLADDDEFALGEEETYPDQSDNCSNQKTTEEEDVLDIGGIDTNLEIEGDDEDQTGIGITECDSAVPENDDICESADEATIRERDRFKNERPSHSGHKPIVFDCNENPNNSTQRQINNYQNNRFKTRGNMSYRGFHGRGRGGNFNRHPFTNNQKRNFHQFPSRPFTQNTMINPWMSQNPDNNNYNQAYHESKKVLINPHFRGNVQPHSDARLIWDPNVGQQNVTPVGVDQFNSGVPPFNKQTQFNSASQMSTNQFSPIWNEQNQNFNNPMLENYNQPRISVPIVTFANNSVQQMNHTMNQQPVIEEHNMPIFANNSQQNMTNQMQQSGFRGRGHHRGGVRFTQANNMIIVRPMPTSNGPNNFDVSNNFSGQGGFNNNGRTVGIEASNRIVGPDQIYQQNQLQIAQQPFVPVYGPNQYQNIQPLQQSTSNANNFLVPYGEVKPQFEQNFNNQIQPNFINNSNNQMSNQNLGVMNMVPNNDTNFSLFQQTSNEHVRKVFPQKQISNLQNNRRMPYIPQNRNFNDQGTNFNQQNTNLSQNNNLIKNNISFTQHNKTFNQYKTPRLGVRRTPQKQYTEVGSSNEPVAKKKKSLEFRNLHEVKTIDVPDTTVTNDYIHEEDEDEETKAYRLKIEEQKKKREEYVKMKEERRKKAAMSNSNLENQDHSMIEVNKTEIANQMVNVMPNVYTRMVKKSAAIEKQAVKRIKGIQKTIVSNNAINRQNVKVIQTTPIRSQQSVINRIKLNNSNVSRPNNVKVRTVLKPNQVTQISSNENIPTPSLSLTVSSTENKSSMMVQRVVRQVSDIDSTESEIIDKEHLTSFLSRRVVVPKSLPVDNNGVVNVSTSQNMLIKTPVVTISNLAASTTEMKLRSMCKGIGVIQSIQTSPDKQQATIKFKNVASAHNFFKKYQRKMVDLSLIDVKLVNLS